MMDRYKNETAQIHAPAALIEKTRAAVREEENRIRKEQAGQAAYAGHEVYRRKRSLHRWTYPLTAAAAVVILLSVSMAMRSIWSGGSMNGETAVDREMTTAEETAAAEETAVAEETYAEMLEETEDGGTAAAAGAESSVEADDAAASENIAGAAADSAAVPEEERSTGAVEDLSEEDTRRGMEQKNSMNDSVMAEESYAEKEASAADMASAEAAAVKGSVQIEAVEERPDFYSDPDAEDIVHEGRIFRVVEEEEGWAAYVEAETGEAYVIRGQIKDLDAFLEEAYGKLAEMTNH